MDSASDYLQIPEDYARWLGGLRWSSGGDAIEDEAGQTFAFAQELALFLEGFAMERPLIHFGCVLLLLHLLHKDQATPDHRAKGLARAFRKSGSQQRNAGALFAFLCQSVPSVAQPLDIRSVCWRLLGPRVLPTFYASWSADGQRQLERPPLSPEMFESFVLQRARSLSTIELEHWFSRGRGPVATADRLAEQLATLRPRAFPDLLGDLEKHPRLAGIVHFVKRLAGAIPLPPRRLAEQEQALGGYADVTTRGQPEHILPSQFALDELEFVRRFAAKELLFFRREPPREKERHQLVILLDQGVRTWGDIRMVLAAAAVAYGKLAARRGLPCLLAGTSNGGRLLDPFDAEPETLASFLEASDLTANPGLALERILEDSGPGAKDIVLLTHPRNLVDNDVTAAARRVSPGCRLFGLALDATGQGELSRVNRGVPLPFRRFRIATDQPEPAHATPGEGQSSYGSPWQGDVEFIPFPFRLGNISPISMGLFAFDDSGEWLLARTDDGLLLLHRIDRPSYYEILPRGWRDDEVTRIRKIVGVAGGFVVIGSVGSDSPVAVHYDLSRRVCKVWHLALDRQEVRWHWSYFKEFHALVAYSPQRGYALDLSTGEWCAEPRSDCITRAVVAYALAATGLAKPARATLDRHTGEILLKVPDNRVQSFTPLADGKPFLMGCQLLASERRGDTLACLVRAMDNRVTLHIFRGPEGIPVGQLGLFYASEQAFALSPDGTHIARPTAGRRQLLIEAVEDLGRPKVATNKGRRHSPQQLRVELGDYWLMIQVRKRTHLLTWKDGKLEHHVYYDRHSFPRSRLVAVSSRTFGEVARPSTGPQNRFRMVAAAELRVSVDAFSQVIVTDREFSLVCMFFAFRDELAAWMPDGTRLGPMSMTGVAETSEAQQRLGRALREATERGKALP